MDDVPTITIEKAEEQHRERIISLREKHTKSMATDLNCRNIDCSNPVSVDRYPSRYCCDSCEKTYKAIIRSNKDLKVKHRMKTVTCKCGCGETFETDHPRQVFKNKKHCNAFTNARKSELHKKNYVPGCTRRSHCIRGHRFTADNTAYNYAGRRVCLTCKKMRDEKRAERKEHV